MIRELDQFYTKFDEPNKSCFLALRKILLSQDVHVTETKKYGAPCFCYKNRMFCFLWLDKKLKEPYLLLVEGRFLDHPLLEKGDRKRMKILRIDPKQDLPIETLELVFQEALNLYRSGQIKTK